MTVTLDAEPERTVDITLVPTNQGASNSDYSLSATSLTFGPTETEQTFTFTAEHDSEDDDDESVELSFGALPDRVNAGTTHETVSINDDDDPSGGGELRAQPTAYRRATMRPPRARGK